eukprot:2313171-Pleurochrysis_carterae.AAC.1
MVSDVHQVGESSTQPFVHPLLCARQKKVCRRRWALPVPVRLGGRAGKVGGSLWVAYRRER